jgi:hypothetical protein
LEFLFQQVRGVFLIFDGLAEDGVAAAVLLFHGSGSFFDVVEHLGFDGGGVGDYGLGLGIHFQYRAAARAGYFECYWRTPHHTENDTPKAGFSEAPA